MSDFYFLFWIVPGILGFACFMLMSKISREKVSVNDFCLAVIISLVPIINFLILIAAAAELVSQITNGSIGKSALFDFRSPEEKLKELEASLKGKQ